ncbi:hypothetical protein M441DRAFT_230479 [Trichoderma asperellum CBS 433.97]|uniref:Uncharacterized protein n=1 Tax=Trichoderma asperellum (strain ATCC 204424 / CBS 433.97 / NBRC 101777) TaxID=1042311 RepID=A0A2T3ZQJ9_TRIA4|nr:hypothetical protein M441DRAFT_230479 [Trichoderma asperellum CBS 433.97]PTB47073.1 hypothetical protein M441DRAFT_230479 [Trichoderma asperellum CBS 433.97]
MYLQPQTLHCLYCIPSSPHLKSWSSFKTLCCYSSWSDILYFMAAPTCGAPCMIIVHYGNLDAPSRFLQRELCLSVSSHFNLASRYNMTWPAPVRS